MQMEDAISELLPSGKGSLNPLDGGGKLAVEEVTVGGRGGEVTGGMLEEWDC